MILKRANCDADQKQTAQGLRSTGRAALWLAVVSLVAGCAGGISKEIRDQVNYTGSFRQLQQNPEKYIGQTVMLGGSIIQTQPMKNGTELLILQEELNSSNRPGGNELSQGRFIIESSQFLDPALYPQGTPITVVGRLQGHSERLIGEMPYDYPIINAIEIKKWSAQEQNYPRFMFGIGVGTHF